MSRPVSRRRFLASALAAASVGSAGLAGCAAPADRDRLDASPTAQFRVTAGREGYRDAAAPETVERVWRLPGVNVGEHTAAKASPLPVPGGDLLVPGDSGLLYRVAPDGEVRWRAATDPSVRGIHGTPAVANGSVYVGAYDGALYAFDLETGFREWRTSLGDAIGSSPLYRDGRLYVAVEHFQPSGSLVAVDAGSGAVAWSDDRPTDHPHSSPALDEATGTLVVGANDGTLYAWRYPSLEFAWRFETGGAIKGPIAARDGAAYVGSWDHRVYRVDLETGTEDWSFETGHMVMSGPGIDPDGRTVYVGGHDERVYALDAETGEPRWSFQADGWLIGCPAVTPAHVLVGAYEGGCYCLEKATGEQRWRTGASGRVTSTPLVHDGAVYFTDRATDRRPGGLYKLGPGST